MIQTIRFKCETITPMFLAGADGKTPELRAPSIKGAMRFWWRALNANLVKGEDYSELRKQESDIFGGTDSGGRSKVIISIDKQSTSITKTSPTPHNIRFSKQAFAAECKFELMLNIVENKIMTAEQVRNLFIIVSLLGGIGNRSRRGFGSFRIIEIDGEVFVQPNSEKGIENIIRKLNPAYPFIVNTARYPFIKSIEIGITDTDITKKIGQITHDVKGENRNEYGNAMGDARLRFSSPIYVSVIKKDDGKLYPIITTLNAVPPTGRANENIQQTFKKELL